MGLTRWAGRAGSVAVIALVGSLLITGPASAEPAPDKQKQAQDLAQQIEDQGTRIAVLDEQFNQARAQADALGAELASMGPKLAESDRQLAAARQHLNEISVESYMRGGSAPLIGALMKSTSEDFGVRRTYVRSALDGQKDALKQFDAARRRLLSLRDQLRATERSVRANVAALDANRRAAEASIASQQSALTQAQGELAPLVAEASAQRAQQKEQQGKEHFDSLAAPSTPPDAGQPRRTAVPGPTSSVAPRPPGAPPRPNPTTTVAHSSSPSTTAAPKPAAPTGPSPPVKSGASAAVNTAKAQLGKPYVYGGAGPDNFDCSGLTMYAWRAGGVGLPHSAAMQYNAIAHIPLSALAPGDLLFYGTDLHHVGIYVGSGQMIEAPYTGANVRYASIYRSDLFGAGRP